jgi:hypothetical protein
MENNDIEKTEPKINKYRGKYKEAARLKYLQNREAIIEKNKAIYKNKKEAILMKNKEHYRENKGVYKLARQLAKGIIDEKEFLTKIKV